MTLPPIFRNPDSQKSGLYSSFPQTILNYIFDNANGFLYIKFQKTCKLLYVKYPFTIVPFFHLHEDYNKKKGTWVNEVGFLFYGKQHKDINNFWLHDRIWGIKTSFLKFQLSKKVLRCSFREILFDETTITENDLKFLLKGSEKLERIRFRYSPILSTSNKKPLAIEDIIAYVKTADCIQITEGHTTSETSKRFQAMKQKTKFTNFDLNKINQDKGIIDPADMFEFIKNNGGVNSYFCLTFDDEEETEIFQDLLDSLLTQLNWTGIREYDEFKYVPGIDTDEIYDQFSEFNNGLSNLLF